ncbi:MAG TPA: outer membrane beta-barrel protein [Aestuariivirga sp.]
MRKTTTLAMLSTALLALAPAAMAQDVNSADKTDVYLGVLGGLVSGTGTTTTPSGFQLIPQPFNPTELGVVGGIRFNRNDWLFGAEADINANLSNTFPPSGLATLAENDGSGHLRGLFGRQMGPMSLFLAGGLAGTHIKYNNTNPGAGVDDKVMLGWTIGVGAEYAATEHIALRFDAMHDETSSAFSDGYNGKWVENTVRVGAIFKF